MGARGCQSAAAVKEQLPPGGLIVRSARKEPNGEGDAQQGQKQVTFGPGKDRKPGRSTRPPPSLGHCEVDRHQQEEDEERHLRARDRCEIEIGEKGHRCGEHEPGAAVSQMGPEPVPRGRGGCGEENAEELPRGDRGKAQRDGGEKDQRPERACRSRLPLARVVLEGLGPGDASRINEVDPSVVEGQAAPGVTRSRRG